MASNTLPFEILLLSPCLLPGQTSFKESKASVKVEPQSGETILFLILMTNQILIVSCVNFYGKKKQVKQFAI